MSEPFKKIKIPKNIFELIVDIYYLTRLEPFKIVQDNDQKINLFDINKYPNFKNILLESIKPIHENFSSKKLDSLDCCGIKSYWENSFKNFDIFQPSEYLIGSIIKVDHNANPWPILFKNNENNIEEINLESGEMVVFKSNNFIEKRQSKLIGLYSRELSFYYKEKA